MSAHTPGPWALVPRSECYGRQPEPGVEWVVSDGRLGWVCVGPGWDDEYRDESYANARLIAAAPELLAACVDALALLRTVPDEFAMPDHPVFGALRDAIAKAEGRA